VVARPPQGRTAKRKSNRLINTYGKEQRASDDFTRPLHLGQLPVALLTRIRIASRSKFSAHSGWL
jgi:hypothetical protein